ncbi:MAG: hypothetical protein AAF907_16440, partial [Planctomycetota bacterium]
MLPLLLLSALAFAPDEPTAESARFVPVPVWEAERTVALEADIHWYVGNNLGNLPRGTNTYGETPFTVGPRYCPLRGYMGP